MLDQPIYVRRRHESLLVHTHDWTAAYSEIPDHMATAAVSSGRVSWHGDKSHRYNVLTVTDCVIVACNNNWLEWLHAACCSLLSVSGSTRCHARATVGLRHVIARWRSTQHWQYQKDTVSPAAVAMYRVTMLNTWEMLMLRWQHTVAATTQMPHNSDKCRNNSRLVDRMTYLHNVEHLEPCGTTCHHTHNTTSCYWC